MVFSPRPSSLDPGRREKHATPEPKDELLTDGEAEELVLGPGLIPTFA